MKHTIDKIKKYESKISKNTSKKNIYEKKLDFYKKKYLMSGGIPIIFGQQPAENYEIYFTLNLRSTVRDAVSSRLNIIKQSLPKNIQQGINVPNNLPHITLFKLVTNVNVGQQLLSQNNYSWILCQIAKEIIANLNYNKLTLISQNNYEMMGPFLARLYDNNRGTNMTIGKLNDKVIQKILKIWSDNIFTKISIPNKKGENMNYYMGKYFASPIYNHNSDYMPHLSMAYIDEQNYEKYIPQYIQKFKEIKQTGSGQLSHINLWSHNITSQINAHRGHVESLTVSISYVTPNKTQTKNLCKIPL
jgi:hypothetical protein